VHIRNTKEKDLKTKGRLLRLEVKAKGRRIE
jgi:hypothetical protein